MLNMRSSRSLAGALIMLSATTLIGCGEEEAEDIGPQPEALSMEAAQAKIDADGSTALLGILDHWEAEAVWAWKTANPDGYMYQASEDIEKEVNGKLDQLKFEIPTEAPADDLIFKNPSPVTKCVYNHYDNSYDARKLDIGGHTYEVNAKVDSCTAAVEFKQAWQYSAQTGLAAGTTIHCMTAEDEEVRGWSGTVSDDDPKGDSDISLGLITECIEKGSKLVFTSEKRENSSPSSSSSSSSSSSGDCSDYIDCICALAAHEASQKAACDAAEGLKSIPGAGAQCEASMDALRAASSGYKAMGIWPSACD